MLAVSSEPGHECSTCGKIYQRSSHLRRHEMTRYSLLTYYSRDVCRKHSLQCPSEGTQADPPLAKRGQKPRACDGCFGSRLACDNEHPCSRCQNQGASSAATRGCFLHRMPTSPAVAANTYAGGGGSSNSTVGSTRMESVTPPHQLPSPETAAESMVRALINEPRCARDEELLMMPMATTSETCGGGGGSNTTEADDALDLFLPSPSGQPGILGDLAANGGLFANSSFFPWSLGPQSMDLDDFYVMKPDDSDLGCFTTATAEGCHADALSTSPGQQQLAPDAAAQEAAIAAVVDALQETHDWFARSGQAYDDGGALARPNVRALVSSYFRNTHHDFPLLHRASFSVEAAAPELLLLLAVVVLCGSLYSPPTDSALSCRGLFHLAEELAFRRLAAALAAAEEAADSAAAAGAAGGGGGGENTMSGALARRRNRTVRLPALVSVVRTLGLVEDPARPLGGGGGRHERRGSVGPSLCTPDADPHRHLDPSSPTGQQSGMFQLPAVHDHARDDGRPAVRAWPSCGTRPGRPSSRARRRRKRRAGVVPGGAAALSRVAVESLMADYDDNNNDNDDDAGAASSARFANLRYPPARPRHRARRVALAGALGPRRAGRAHTPEELSRRGLVRHSGELCWLANKMLAVLVSGAAEDSGYFQGHFTRCSRSFSPCKASHQIRY
ncbi:hypothetical protein GGTG_04797 [Gaeumannomyces tritici R3-111a-1]|uniref:C2H2-type domain-containing protein n=1 Tax=Gaeumannomyces tritici (strain R3-111a-1) TaxID=644352 RepID=J3NU45_GAET3|nr:hypothetical protein GGTG_04797 [Gaeumannomyces tritici R3-111a-1]EJT79713.1 hypothetical protein GGTG_04797 [Gaeumannomyces tritici R3-111a-1]